MVASSRRAVPVRAPHFGLNIRVDLGYWVAPLSTSPSSLPFFRGGVEFN